MKAVTSGAWFGAAFAAIGVLIYVMLRIDPSGANAPGFVVDAAAGCFFFAGISVVARAWGAELLARLCALPVVYLLAVPGLWIMLGDSGECSVSTGLFGLGGSGTADAGLCRVVFGGGALVVVAFAAIMTVAFFRRGKVDARPDGNGRPVSDQR